MRQLLAGKGAATTSQDHGVLEDVQHHSPIIESSAIQLPHDTPHKRQGAAEHAPYKPSFSELDRLWDATEALGRVWQRRSASPSNPTGGGFTHDARLSRPKSAGDNGRNAGAGRPVTGAPCTTAWLHDVPTTVRPSHAAGVVLNSADEKLASGDEHQQSRGFCPIASPPSLTDYGCRAGNLAARAPRVRMGGRPVSTFAYGRVVGRRAAMAQADVAEAGRASGQPENKFIAALAGIVPAETTPGRDVQAKIDILRVNTHKRRLLCG